MSHNLSHCIVTTDTKVRRGTECGSHQAGGDIVISSYSRLLLVFRDTFLLYIFVTSGGVRWKVLRKDSIMWASVTIFPPARSQYTQYISPPARDESVAQSPVTWLLGTKVTLSQRRHRHTLHFPYLHHPHLAPPQTHTHSFVKRVKCCLFEWTFLRLSCQSILFLSNCPILYTTY